MTVEGCEFCCDAPVAEFDGCQVCGRGLDEPARPEPKRAPLLEAVRKARGQYTGAEVERMIKAYNEGSASVGGPDVPLDLDPGEHLLEVGGRRICVIVAGERRRG